LHIPFANYLNQLIATAVMLVTQRLARNSIHSGMSRTNGLVSLHRAPLSSDTALDLGQVGTDDGFQML